ncbi:hypothetical protein Acsp03_26470 [Actinomadura sp. NBRC 104412]|uniref:DUF397 domain-containing protein n=1 Tax=Actinomadura sp. NBRC 104412 TaxID=3032203 RepID=UPI0024A4E617|nr:DUF397 domain-containing protein [Actinomadura sp. NBRC 104412]GLZ05181.1 hypothetical protein Acsp03_26470 [Actinomadura sp. NBRC 104412]
MELGKVVWRKASRSHEDGDQCVEVASIAHVVAVRDSKDPKGPKRVLSRQNFSRLADVLKRG